MDGLVLAFYEPCLFLVFFVWQWWSLRKDKSLLAAQRKLEQSAIENAKTVLQSDS